MDIGSNIRQSPPNYHFHHHTLYHFTLYHTPNPHTNTNTHTNTHPFIHPIRQPIHSIIVMRTIIRIFLQFVAITLSIALIYHSTTSEHQTERAVLSLTESKDASALRDWLQLAAEERAINPPSPTLSSNSSDTPEIAPDGFVYTLQPDPYEEERRSRSA